MKPWEKILQHFDITVTTCHEYGKELIVVTDPKAAVIPKGIYVFNQETDPVLNIKTTPKLLNQYRKRELTKAKIKIANKIIKKVFQ
ncbi:hypothetical protein ACE939_00745 [Aquimarina sp. W85]|uniref:hypothetical protein n=1 Tax=Aquimarina rhodophyticola TaxID=3342246 RepID=UPI00366B5159